MRKIKLKKKTTNVAPINQEGEEALECKANIKTYGNIWTRRLEMNEGEAKTGHKHEFDHLHFLVSGSITIRVFDEYDRDTLIFKKIYKAPAWIKVPKEHFHDITALEDNVIGYCIQAITNKDGNVIATDYANDKDWMDEVKEFERFTNLDDEIN